MRLDFLHGSISIQLLAGLKILHPFVLKHLFAYFAVLYYL